MTASTVTVESAGNKSIPVNIEAVTEPVVHHSRKLYAKAATGAQWYAEQWEDLLVEAGRWHWGPARTSRSPT